MKIVLQRTSSLHHHLFVHSILHQVMPLGTGHKHLSLFLLIKPLSVSLTITNLPSKEILPYSQQKPLIPGDLAIMMSDKGHIHVSSTRWVGKFLKMFWSYLCSLSKITTALIFESNREEWIREVRCLYDFTIREGGGLWACEACVWLKTFCWSKKHITTLCKWSSFRPHSSKRDYLYTPGSWWHVISMALTAAQLWE